MNQASDALPHVDEHAVRVDATLDATWAASLQTVDRWLASAGRTARLLGCADTIASGPRPLEAGSTLPGFHVEDAEPRQRLVLAGRHRFSDYALIFHLAATVDGATDLRAETRGAFPGAKGSVYRALVIGTRGHVLVTRRLLSSIQSRAERGVREAPSG